MNLVTFNDPFKAHMPAMLKKLAVDTPDHYEGLRLEPLLKAPLFLYGFSKYAAAPALSETPWVHDGRKVKSEELSKYENRCSARHPRCISAAVA